MTGSGISVDRTQHEGVALLNLAGSHESNALGEARMRRLAAIFRDLNEDNSILSVVLYGGEGHSFAVGGDFNETSTFTGGAEVDRWIDDITELYCASLHCTKPVVAAVSGYAIGIGLQLLLTADYRIGSAGSVVQMPEFRLGIACNFGGYMLERSVGRAVMQEMLMSCDPMNADRATRVGIYHEMTDDGSEVSRAIERAAEMAKYNPSAFRSTKPHLNEEYILGLRKVQSAAKRAHRAAFASGLPQERMRAIIDRE